MSKLITNTITPQSGDTVTVSNKLNVQGLLTYEDVTNVDSVGIITARDGIICTGIVTATTFEGSGASLTSLPSAQLTGALPAIDGSNLTGINTPDADKIIEGNTKAEVVDTGSDGHFKVETEGAERLRIDSSGNANFGAEKAVALPSGTGIQVYNTSTPRIKLVNDTTGNTNADGFQLYLSGSGVILDQKENAEMRFYTNATEKLRITAGGLLDVSGGIHVTENVTPSSGRGVEIFEASAGVGQIQSFNRTGGSFDELKLKGSEVRIHTGSTNALTLDLQSTQSTLYGTVDGILNLDTTDGRGPFIRFKENGSTKGWVGSAEGMGGGISGDQDDLGVRALDNIMFSANGAERLRIASNGAFGLGGANYGTAGQVLKSNGSGSAVTWGDVSVGFTTEAQVKTNGQTATLNIANALDHKVTCTGTVTIDAVGGTPDNNEGESHTIRIINNGSATVGFSTFFLFPSGATPSLPTVDGAVSLISFTVNRVGAGGTQLLAGASVNYS